MSCISHRSAISDAQRPSTRSGVPEPFRIEIERARNTARVTPVGEMDMATVGEVKKQLRDLEREGFQRLVIDLGKLTFMDSTGLHLLIECDAHAREDGIEFAVIQGPPTIHRVLEITGLTELLPLRVEAFDE